MIFRFFKFAWMIVLPYWLLTPKLVHTWCTWIFFPVDLHLRHAAGLKRPTLIQRHAVPIVGHQEHYDLVAQAQTGTNSPANLVFIFVVFFLKANRGWDQHFVIAGWLQKLIVWAVPKGSYIMKIEHFIILHPKFDRFRKHPWVPKHANV